MEWHRSKELWWHFSKKNCDLISYSGLCLNSWGEIVALIYEINMMNPLRKLVFGKSVFIFFF